MADKGDSIYSDLHPALAYDSKTKDIAIVIDMQSILTSIDNIWGTTKTERVFNRAFGSNIEKYLFEPADNLTLNALETEMLHSLSIWDNRLRIENVRSSIFHDRHIIITNGAIIVEGLENEKGSFEKAISSRM